MAKALIALHLLDTHLELPQQLLSVCPPPLMLRLPQCCRSVWLKKALPNMLLVSISR